LGSTEYAYARKVIFLKVRKAAVAGQFYPGSKDQISELLEESWADPEYGPGHALECGAGERQTMAVVCPHAGYTYSASAAAWSYDAILRERVPDTAIILGTQHTGYYSISVLKEGAWQTPLGNAEVDSDVAAAILAASDLVQDDETAFFSPPHSREHNIEVQIPFLQYASSDIKIVPITVGVMEYGILEDLGKALANVVNEAGKDVVIIASSDMTHMQVRDPRDPEPSVELQKERDQAVADAVAAFDIPAVWDAARKTTVCGPQTIVTAMHAANALGATSPTVMKYYTSYEKTGSRPPCDYSVGYMAAAFRRV